MRGVLKKDQVMNAKRNQGLTLYPWSRDSRLNENTCIYNWSPWGVSNIMQGLDVACTFRNTTRAVQMSTSTPSAGSRD